jgi:hypothetical protein
MKQFFRIGILATFFGVFVWSFQSSAAVVVPQFHLNNENKNNAAKNKQPVLIELLLLKDVQLARQPTVILLFSKPNSLLRKQSLLRFHCMLIIGIRAVGRTNFHRRCSAEDRIFTGKFLR